jgi:hypothetical protein
MAPYGPSRICKPLFGKEMLIGAVGIEHDPLFLSPAIRWRCNPLPNSIADSAE